MNTAKAIAYGFLGSDKAPGWAFAFHYCHIWILPTIATLVWVWW